VLVSGELAELLSLQAVDEEVLLSEDEVLDKLKAVTLNRSTGVPGVARAWAAGQRAWFRHGGRPGLYEVYADAILRRLQKAGLITFLSPLVGQLEKPPDLFAAEALRRLDPPAATAAVATSIGVQPVTAAAAAAAADTSADDSAAALRSAPLSLAPPAPAAGPPQSSLFAAEALRRLDPPASTAAAAATATSGDDSAAALRSAPLSLAPPALASGPPQSSLFAAEALQRLDPPAGNATAASSIGVQPVTAAALRRVDPPATAAAAATATSGDDSAAPRRSAPLSPPPTSGPPNLTIKTLTGMSIGLVIRHWGSATIKDVKALIEDTVEGAGICSHSMRLFLYPHGLQLEDGRTLELAEAKKRKRVC
jgi:hypothetical protein